MDRSEVRAIVEREIGPLMAALGVSWWKVVVEYGPIQVPKGTPDAFVAAARCDRKPDYNRATITIDPEKCDSGEDVMEYLVHELAHLVLAPFDLYRQFATKYIEANSPGDHQEDAIFAHVVEQAVIGVERIWTCAPAYWRTRGSEDRGMPTKPGEKRITRKSAAKSSIGPNIAKLVKGGVDQDQAVAEALSIQREQAKKKGKKAAYPEPPKKKKGS
jgi:hypothetical protein